MPTVVEGELKGEMIEMVNMRWMMIKMVNRRHHNKM